MIDCLINEDDENKTSSLQLETRSDPRPSKVRADAKIVLHFHNETVHLLPLGCAMTHSAPFLKICDAENTFTATVDGCGGQTPRELLTGCSEEDKGLRARLTSDEQPSSGTRCPKLIFSDARVAAGILTCHVCDL